MIEIPEPCIRMPNGEDKFPIIADVEAFKVGCVIIQAVHGCTRASSVVSTTFDSEDWAVNHTPGMKKYMINLEEARTFASNCREMRKLRSQSSA